MEKTEYSVAETAKILKVTRATVYRLIASGRLKKITSPLGVIKIPQEEIKRIITTTYR